MFDAHGNPREGVVVHNGPKGFTRIRRFKLDEVLPLVGQDKHTFEWDGGSVGLKMRTQRMQLFRRGQSCECCGIRGSHFWLEYSGHNTPHFNLYALNGYGHECLMTVDHIHPRSLGGKTTPQNIQLLCQRCNKAKKNDCITLEELRQRVFQPSPNASQAHVGHWVRVGDAMGRIVALQRRFCQVALWCPCMGKGPVVHWKYRDLTVLNSAQVAAIKDGHLLCAPNPLYLNGEATVEGLVRHLMRKPFRLSIPRFALAG